MIEVKFKKKGFKVNGHALFANPGDDIVCSAVSVTTISVINSITKIVGEDNLVIHMDQKSGLIDFEVFKTDIKVETLFEYFNDTMIELAKNYSAYIKIIN